jgi:hypothetical protein
MHCANGRAARSFQRDKRRRPSMSAILEKYNFVGFRKSGATQSNMSFPTGNADPDLC